MNSSALMSPGTADGRFGVSGDPSGAAGMQLIQHYCLRRLSAGNTTRKRSTDVAGTHGARASGRESIHEPTCTVSDLLPADEARIPAREPLRCGPTIPPLRSPGPVTRRARGGNGLHLDRGGTGGGETAEPGRVWPWPAAAALAVRKPAPVSGKLSDRNSPRWGIVGSQLGPQRPAILLRCVSTGAFPGLAQGLPRCRPAGLTTTIGPMFDACR